MLSRILEPEVMDSVAEAEDYNAMDHSQVNRVFVDDFLAALPKAENPPARPRRIFDAGTGTAQIPIELLRRGIEADITAADLAEHMLVVARRNLAAAGLESAVRLVRCDCKWLDQPDASYDAVMSNSIVHHIPTPRDVLRECWRLTRPGGILFVRDLMRPDSQAVLDQLVQIYAATANAHGQQMFRDSLHAALTLEAVRELCPSLGMPPAAARATSDRHWKVSVIKACTRRPPGGEHGSSGPS
jgi:ubiquinone/menaquinone biosynthesis C-methylase UbiE